MKRFFRGLSAVSSCSGAPLDSVKSFTNPFKDSNTSGSSKSQCFSLGKESGERRISEEPRNFDNIFVTKAGYLVLLSFLVDARGSKLGEERVHMFVVSPHGMVLLEEKDGVRVFPGPERAMSGSEVARLEQQIETTKRALNLAFKKKSRGESRLKRQSHVLATLEQELSQVMKDIKHTSRQLNILARSSDDTKAQVVTLLHHEISKIEVELRAEEPEFLEKYDKLKSSKQTTAFKKAVQKKIHNLEKIRELAEHKYFIQKTDEKDIAEAKTETKPKRKLRRRKKEKVQRNAHKGQRQELVTSLLQVSDARRSGEIRQILETEL